VDVKVVTDDWRAGRVARRDVKIDDSDDSVVEREEEEE
jgi:hypothetical protein